MASIPEYSKGVIKPRQVAQTADPNAIQDAGATAFGVAKAADIGYEFAQKHKEANDLTAVNDAIIAKQKEDLEFIESARKQNESNPFGFAKKIEPELTKRDQERQKSLPSKEAQRAYLETTKRLNLGIYEDNFNWENTRKTQIYANRLKNSMGNNSLLAMEAGRSGKPLDEYLRNADATAYAAGGVLSPEMVTNARRTGRAEAVTNWLQGVSEADPVRALQEIESDAIKKHFEDSDQYLKTRDAIRERALKSQEINSKMEVLKVLSDENSLLTKSLSAPIPYAEVEEATIGMSKDAKEYFMKANGYSKTEKLTPEGQLKFKSDLYDQLTQLTNGSDSVSLDAMSSFQSKIYQGMNNGSLDEKEGSFFLSQISAPMVEKKSAELQKFSDEPFFGINLGVDGLNKIFKQDFEIENKLSKKEKNTASGKAVSDQIEAENNMNKIKLYDSYMKAVSTIANEYNVDLTQIDSLNEAQRRTLFKDAQIEARKIYLSEKYPKLSDLPDVPNQILSGDRLIPGMAGKRDIKSDFSAGVSDFILLEKNGIKARKYPDGRIEVIK